MARIQPAPYRDDDDPGGAPGRGRKAVRYAVPVAVVGVAAATIGLVPALAASGSPALPTVSAEQLLAKIAGSNTQTVDGTVRFTADLGLPAALSGGSASGLFGGGGAPGGLPGAGKSSPAAPQAQLVQLLVGSHTLHVAADGQDLQKVSIIEPAAEYSIIHNGTQLWAYDSKSDQAYHQTLSQNADRQSKQDGTAPGGVPTTPQAAAQQILKAANGTAAITVDGTARVAGRSAYELLVTPQHADTTTVGSIRIAVDSKTGVPLKFTLAPKGGGKAVFDIGFTKVSFAKPAASTFSFTPPKGVKVTEGTKQDTAKGTSGAEHGKQEKQDRRGKQGGAADKSGQPTFLGKGWDSIAVITTSGGASDSKGLPGGFGKGGKSGKGSAQSLMNSFGTQVNGKFGTGTLFHTRLVNALLTDKGTLYVGAVTESALTDAANAAGK